MVVGIDRSRMFKRARRHTLFVKTMRVLLPAVTLGAIAIYGGSVLLATSWNAETALRTIAKILPENLAMHNPHYEGYMDDGGKYYVTALTANQDLKKPGHIKLNKISGVLTDTKGVKTRITSEKGTFDTRNSSLRLGGGINIASDDGMRAKLVSAVVKPKVGTIASNSPVEVEMPGGSVKAAKLRIWQKKKLVVFVGGVQTRLTPPSEGTQPQADARTASTSLMGGSSEPVDIASTQLKVDREKGKATFIGNVNAVQGDQTLKTALLDVFFEESNSKESATANATAANPLGGSNTRIKSISIPQPLIMRRGQSEQLTGSKAEFDVLNDKATITGNVVMSAGPDQRAVAEVANLDSKSDTILLTGNVLVTQGQNQLRGDRLFVNRARGQSRMTNPVRTGPNAGRIFARLIRPEAAAGAKNKAAAKPLEKVSDVAGASALSLTSFKSDPGAPTEITAVSLDVDDKRSAATFLGDVRVDQGQISMRANKITAFYNGNAGLVSQGSPSGRPVAGASNGAELKRIRADGKVIVKSKGAGQTASGDWADIDMVQNTVQLGGDVVLNQGKNVIRATSLNINMKTGNAVIDTLPGQAGAGWASTLVQPTRKGNLKTPIRSIRGGRPSAVFYPTQLQKGAGGTAKKKPQGADASAKPARPTQNRQPVSSSWEATTETGGQ